MISFLLVELLLRGPPRGCRFAFFADWNAVVRYGVLGCRTVDFRWRSVGAALRLARRLMLVPGTKFIYVAWHGNIEKPFAVIPLQRDTAV